MPKNTRAYRTALLESLADPVEAAYYLNAAIEDSQESFLTALKNVAQANQMAKVAREAGVQRETLYRSLSEQGNPTLDTLASILGAVGLKLLVAPEDGREEVAPLPAVPAPTITVSTTKIEVGTTSGGTIVSSSGDITTLGSFVNFTTQGVGLAVITSPQNIDPIIDIPAMNGFYGHITQQHEKTERWIG